MSVNPAGFDMRNAQDVDDIIWPLMDRYTDGGDRTWGLMIVEDRKAQMSGARRMNDVSVGYGLGARRAARVIRTALAGGLDQHPDQIY